MISDKLKNIFQEIFYALTVSLTFLVFLELIFPRIVLSYINLSYLLLAWLIFGIILLVMPGKIKSAVD
jgi:hypothetical protein